MANKNVKRISMILAALMVAGTATGCGAKKDTKVESTNKAAAHSAKLDEDAIKDTYTGIDDMYVLEGSKDVDYLDGVLYDSSIVKGIDVDSSKVDASKAGDYKITFSITADRKAYDAFRDAFIKSETAKDKLSADKAKTDKGSADKTKTKTKTETVKVKKDTVVVNRDEAQKLADQNKLVRTDNGETVKKSDGTEVKTEQKAPASTAVTGGNVVDASAKTEVKPEITAAPAMSPEEAKKEEAKKDDKKEETKKPSTSGSKDNSGGTSKPNSGSNSKPSHKSDSGSNKQNNGSGSNSKPSSKPNSGSNKPNNGNSSNSKPSHKPDSGSNKPNSGNGSNSKPSHTHTWVNITKTVNHPAVTHQEDVYENRQVKVKDAWDEKVKSGTISECLQCGYRTTDNDAMDMHCLEEAHSSHWITLYKTVHHDAVYETQRVKVGTRTVTDKAAWTETVIIGQKCSSCGKRK